MTELSEIDVKECVEKARPDKERDNENRSEIQSQKGSPREVKARGLGGWQGRHMNYF